MTLRSKLLLAQVPLAIAVAVVGVLASVTNGKLGLNSELILKVSPPRAPRHLLVRPRLASDEAQFRDRPIILVQAPAGFGKTALLAQWRREHLGRGATVLQQRSRASYGLRLQVSSADGAGRAGHGHDHLGSGIAGCVTA